MKNEKQSLRQRLTAALGNNSRQWLQGFTTIRAAAGTPSKKISNTSKVLHDELPSASVRHSFSSELFAELLIELPEFQQKISQAYQAGDLQGLRNDVHQLLGAIVYCDAPELEGALRALHQALATTSTESIDSCYIRAFNTVNSTLTYSGFSDCR
ncbi:MAG: Hpt domain-containing protein [Gammaproteobacteria bacterium]|nr:Hpt domain-containing protein [Gammaproteobacteria bacterium]MDH3971736.1 Hpt domain-containing protein [Gammaproteobacteria bacterium]MDH3986768.1 Hpt domain-containing protein [Gammaproteobacteria bacterium]